MKMDHTQLTTRNDINYIAVHDYLVGDAMTRLSSCTVSYEALTLEDLRTLITEGAHGIMGTLSMPNDWIGLPEEYDRLTYHTDLLVDRISQSIESTYCYG